VQTLARAAVQRQREAHFEGRVHLDVSGYRQRRKVALEQFALRLAEEVATSGVEKALEPMGSADRKIVHDIVGTVDGVRTLSVGDEPRRRVVISPAGD
jgi:spoIIIJ-associated protein